ncbi:MAG: hypothetical protein LBS59_03190 [Puniceicoccales bacterium]|nr:hypothetical protein [Puniceicoccales bacterium]
MRFSLSTVVRPLRDFGSRRARLPWCGFVLLSHVIADTTHKRHTTPITTANKQQQATT